MRWFAVFTILAALACALCEVVELTDATFDKAVRKQDQWVLEFYADWCGYCSRFRPKYEAIERQARDFSTPVYFGAINVDKNPRLAARFFVSRLPTLVHVFDKQVRVLTIPSPPSQLAQFLQEEQWRDIKPEGIFMSAYGPFGMILGYAGIVVEYVTMVSPYTYLGVAFAALAIVIGAGIVFARPAQQQHPGSAPTSAAGETKSSTSSATATATASPTTRSPRTRTRSRKID